MHEEAGILQNTVEPRNRAILGLSKSGMISEVVVLMRLFLQSRLQLSNYRQSLRLSFHPSILPDFLLPQ